MQENITLLLAYVPELSRVEQSWACLRANFLSRRLWSGCGTIVDAHGRAVSSQLQLTRIRHMAEPSEERTP